MGLCSGPKRWETVPNPAALMSTWSLTFSLVNFPLKGTQAWWGALSRSPRSLPAFTRNALYTRRNRYVSAKNQLSTASAYWDMCAWRPSSSREDPGVLDFIYGDHILTLPIKHFFHLDCVGKWLVISLMSPYYRLPVCCLGNSGKRPNTGDEIPNPIPNLAPSMVFLSTTRGHSWIQIQEEPLNITNGASSTIITIKF